jgi:hypothetical protein
MAVMVTVVVASMMTRANRHEYREAAAERHGNQQAGNNAFHHFSPLRGV